MLLQTLRADLYESYQISLNDFAPVFPIISKDAMVVRNNRDDATFYAKLCAINQEKHDDDLRSAFQEISALIRINHPAVIKIYGYSPVDFDNKPNPVILINYYGPFITLSDLFSEQKLSRLSTKFTSTNRLIIIYGIASGMAALHSKNIIVQNFQADNVLLDSNYKPYISNFYLPLTSNNYESLIYVAPEVHKTRKYTKESNVYSFGIMLFQFLTETDPFSYLNIKTRYQLIKRVVSGAGPIFQGEYCIQSSYKNLIERCCARDPLQRPSFEAILKEFSNITDPMAHIPDTIRDKEKLNTNYTFNEDYLIDNVDTNTLMEYIESLENKYQVIDNNKDINFLQTFSHEVLNTYADNIHMLNQLKFLTSKYKSLNNELRHQAKVKTTRRPIANHVMSYSEFVSKPSATFENLIVNEIKKLDNFKLEYESIIKDQNQQIIQRSDIKITPNLQEAKKPSEIKTEIDTFYKTEDQFIEKVKSQLAAFEEVAQLLPEHSNFQERALDQDYVETIQAMKNDANSGHHRNEEIVEHLLGRASIGCIDSLNALGILYKTGQLNWTIDQQKSIEYFQKAAKLGNVSSINSVGVYYETVLKKFDCAFLLYLVASKKKCPEGYLNLGRCFLYGIGTERDEKKALLFLKKLYRSRDEQVNIEKLDDIAFWIGLVYYKGYGIEKNIDTAIEYLNPLVDRNHKDAIYLMGKCYQEKNSMKKAIELFTKGDALGSIQSTYELGQCYQQIGKKNPSDKFIKKAIDNGYKDELVDFNQCYEDTTL